MEVEDEEAKDFIQRQRYQWEELARHPDRIDIVLEKILKHFLEHPNAHGFKAQLVAVDRKACALYKTALDNKLKARCLRQAGHDAGRAEGYEAGRKAGHDEAVTTPEPPPSPEP
jgi:type I restriction enzyme, R subunit